MRTWGCHALVACVAALVLATGVSTASARRLSFSSGPFRSVWTSAEFEIREAGVIRCRLTLEGSLHSRTLSKVSGALVGYVTRASMGSPCTGGELHLLAETLPWHLRYNSFTGTLPAIETVRFQIVGFSLWLMWFEIRCLYVSTAARPIYATRFSEHTGPFGEFTPARFDLEGTLPEGGSFQCPNPIVIHGSGNFTVPGTSTAITVQLVQ
jgi:hypothetical protein